MRADAQVVLVLKEARTWLVAAIAVRDPAGELDEVTRRLMQLVMEVDAVRRKLSGEEVVKQSEAA